SGNVIGLNSARIATVANSGNGVHLLNAPSNTVGGATAAAGNLIAGNNGAGVRIEGVAARDNVVLGNVVGLDGSGNVARANQSHGVHVAGNARFNRIGGVAAGEGNTLWFNNGDGIYVENGTNNTLRGNSTFGNAGLGIDLGGNGVTANDDRDLDNG